MLEFSVQVFHLIVRGNKNTPGIIENVFTEGFETGKILEDRLEKQKFLN